MKRLVATTALVLMACGGGGEGGSSDSSSGGAAAAAAPLGNGTITGMVMFSGDAPANPSIDMAEEAVCAERWTDGAVDPIVSVNNGHLSNVFVKITAGLPGGDYPMPAEDAYIDQIGCIYTPRVVGVMVGQTLEIMNSDPLLHNVKATPSENRGFNRSQPRAGMSTRESFNAPEMIPLECSVHGWMNAYVAVVDHPYFATSDDNGAFTISGLPAGTYTLEAWHETLGTQTAEVTIGDDGAGSVEFTFGG